MTTLRITNARVLTLDAADAANPLGRMLPGADVAITNGFISNVSECASRSSSPCASDGRSPHDPRPAIHDTLDARGRVLMPAFIDAHTHACFAGDRLDEWDLKRRGVPYLDILKAGGGIMATVRAVRATPQDELAARLRDRLDRMLAAGTATIEVKSGYGLAARDELKMLRAIRAAASGFPGTVVPTALLGHALDPDAPPERFIDTTINHTLPAVHEEFPGIAVDAFCEDGAWPLDACIRLFERAAALGHPVRVHADQFNALGMTEWALAHGVRSVDHLEATRPQTLRALAASPVHPVLLPGTGFHTDGRFADGRSLVDAGAGGRLVIATNFNPGSSPCGSMPMAIALAVRGNRLTPREAIAACTRNAAALLGLADRGVIAEGRRADLVLLRHTDERMLAYEFGGDPVDEVIVAGVRR